MSASSELRPVERRVLHWAGTGLDDDEIGRRFRRSPQWASQVRRLSAVERQAPAAAPSDERLRPLERRVLRWRADGASHEELAPRFRRSPESVARIEDYARYKLADS